MSSTNNLAQLFSQSVNQSHRSSNSASASQGNPAPVPYNRHSKAVNAEDDNHFENTTFQLKRTRSLGLLDEFIAPTKKLIEEDEIQNNTAANSTRSLTLDFDGDDTLDNQFIENIDDEKHTATTRGENGSEETENFIASPESKVYASDEYNDDEMEDDDFNNDDDDGSLNNNRYNKADTALSSPSSPSSASSLSLFQPHDDNDIVYEPSKQVDYLSHDWKESDVSKSWRYIVLKRKDVANSARLENASWRTWAQAKYHLKTISPEAVNWLKDSDVTWLYGPLYKEPSSQRNHSGYGSDSEGKGDTITAKKQQQRKGPKPILKKRTVCEILSQPSLITVSHRNGHHRRTGHSPIIEAYSENSNSYNLPSPPRIEDDFDEISRKVNAQYKNSSNTQLSNQRQQQQTQQQPQQQPPQPQQQLQQQQQPPQPTVTRQDQEHQFRPTPITTVMSNTSSILSSKLESVSASADSVPKRHIHFNDRVEQCIAVDTSYNDDHDNPDNHDNRGSSDSDNSEDDAFADNDSDSDEEAGFFLMVRSPSAPQIHNQIPLTEVDESDAIPSREHEEQEQKRLHERYQTIALLPSTTLKYGSDDDEDYDNYALSHNVNTSRGFNYYYDYNSVFTSDSSAVSGDLSSNSKFQFEQDIAPQHLEGVNMVDVPENIVLGASVSETTPALTNTTLLSESSPTTEASIHSHSSSGSDDSLNNKNFGSKENFTKVSSSPSYASLSDVAAQGYISHNPDSSNLSDVISFIGSGTATENAVIDDDKNIVEHEANSNNNHNNGNSFKNTLLNSWKRS